MQWTSGWSEHTFRWRRWFAWHPVVTEYGTFGTQWVWLEMVERAWEAAPYGGYWVYRPLQKDRVA